MFWHNGLHYDAVLCIVLVYHAAVVGNSSLRPFSVTIALLSYQATVHYTVYTHTFVEMVTCHTHAQWVNCMTNENIGCLDLDCMSPVEWCLATMNKFALTYRLGMYGCSLRLDLLSRSTWHTHLHIFGKSSICIVWLVIVSCSACIVPEAPIIPQNYN